VDVFTGVRAKVGVRLIGWGPVPLTMQPYTMFLRSIVATGFVESRTPNERGSVWSWPRIS